MVLKYKCFELRFRTLTKDPKFFSLALSNIIVCRWNISKFRDRNLFFFVSRLNNFLKKTFFSSVFWRAQKQNSEKITVVMFVLKIQMICRYSCLKKIEWENKILSVTITCTFSLWDKTSWVMFGFPFKNFKGSSCFHGPVV